MSLVEIIISLSIMVIIFAAIVPIFRSINNGWDSKAAVAEVLQNGRVLIDHLNLNLAKAVEITAVSSSSEANGYIEFKDNDDATFRYDIAASNYVEFGNAGNLSELAGPVSKLQFTCYDVCDLDTPISDLQNVTSTCLVRIDTTLTNSAARSQDKNLMTEVFLCAKGNPDFKEEEDEKYSSGVALKEKINYGGGLAVFDTYNSSFGSYGHSNSSSFAVVTVNSTNKNVFTLYSSATVEGDGYIGPGANIDKGFNLSGGSHITGTMGVLESVVDIPDVSKPTGSIFNGSSEGNRQLWGSMTDTLSSDHYYNNLQLYGSSKLIINGDVTILVKSSFEIGNDAEIEILPGSSLNLYVGNNCGIGGKLNVSTEDPSKLRIYMTGNNKTFEMWGIAEVHAILQNPNGSVKIWNTRPFFGLIKAKNLEGNGPVHIDLDASF